MSVCSHQSNNYNYIQFVQGIGLLKAALNASAPIEAPIDD